MTNSFTITTTATDAVKTDAKGHAEAVFTVTNTTTHPVRGMARAKALDGTKSEWLQITGETERDFPPGGTQQFVVTFDAPAAATPKPTTAGAAPATTPPSTEQFSFRLDVASAMNPDDDFTEGPTVRVQTAAPAIVKEVKAFPKWIFIPIGVVLLLVIGIVLWLALRNTGPEVYNLPDVAGISESEARELLETGCKDGAGCVVVAVTQIADNTVAKGIAVKTDPAADAGVAIGSNVTLFISGEPAASPTPAAPPETFKLPAVANQTEAAAKVALAGKCKTADPCVEVEVNKVTDNQVANGLVIRIEPKEGTEVNVGSKVTMFVSKGPDKVTIISVAKLPADTAREKLEASCGSTDCLDVEVNVVADNTVSKGLVIRTEPIAGAVVSVGAKVKMFVSGGTDEVMIPYVRNRLLADARSLIEHACSPAPCLKIAQTNKSDDVIAAGRALSTTPAPSMVKIGSSILLFVSTGPELRTIGLYKGMSEQQARQRIVADGFTVGTVQRLPFPQPGKVDFQSPTAGSKQPKGAKVNIHMSGLFP